MHKRPLTKQTWENKQHLAPSNQVHLGFINPSCLQTLVSMASGSGQRHSKYRASCDPSWSSGRLNVLHSTSELSFSHASKVEQLEANESGQQELRTNPRQQDVENHTSLA